MSRKTPEQVRNKLGLVAAKKLQAASDALHAYRMACIECGDLSASQDRRHSLVGEIDELGRWLESVCEAENRRCAAGKEA